MDATRLYRIHRALTAEHASGARKLRLDDEFRGNAADYLAAAIVEELEGQLDTGYLSRRGDNFVPTWKGALLMTWSQLWPFKAIRIARRDRHAREVIAALE